MSGNQTKVLVIELPEQLMRDAKIEAVRRGITLKQWWTEAAMARLRKRETEPAE